MGSTFSIKLCFSTIVSLNVINSNVLCCVLFEMQNTILLDCAVSSTQELKVFSTDL